MYPIMSIEELNSFDSHTFSLLKKLNKSKSITIKEIVFLIRL